MMQSILTDIFMQDFMPTMAKSNYGINENANVHILTESGVLVKYIKDYEVINPPMIKLNEPWENPSHRNIPPHLNSLITRLVKSALDSVELIETKTLYDYSPDAAYILCSKDIDENNLSYLEKIIFDRKIIKTDFINKNEIFFLPEQQYFGLIGERINEVCAFIITNHIIGVKIKEKI